MYMKLSAMVAIVLILVMSPFGNACAPPSSPTPQENPPATPTQTDQHPIEVVSVTGPLPPINPGGPIVGIVLKNISSEPVVSLNATLELGRSFVISFDVSPNFPLSPGGAVTSRVILIGGGFGDNASYPLKIEGVTQGGASFDYTTPVMISPVTAYTLPGSQWQAVSINGTPVIDGSLVSLTFGNDGTFGGYAGVNYYGGNFIINAPEILFSHIMITLLLGPDKRINQQEAEYISCLDKAASFHVRDGRLEMFDSSGRQLLTFERMP